MRHAPSFLDRPAARLVAGAVFAAAVAALMTIHWERLFPPAPTTDGLILDKALSDCMSKAKADIAAMRTAGAISEEQAALFATRAEARCRAQSGG